MTRLFTFFLPPTPDAAATCPPARYRHRHRHRHTHKNLGGTQDLCFCICRHSNNQVRVISLFSCGHSTDLLFIGPPCLVQINPLPSVPSLLHPLLPPSPSHPPPTPNIFAIHCAIYHVQTCLLVVKGNRIPVHVFCIRSVLLMPCSLFAPRIYRPLPSFSSTPTLHLDHHPPSDHRPRNNRPPEVFYSPQTQTH